jgi:ComF family protein
VACSPNRQHSSIPPRWAGVNRCNRALALRPSMSKSQCWFTLHAGVRRAPNDTYFVCSLRAAFHTAILKKIRPVRAPIATAGRGRIVFSSNGSPIRATGTRVVAQDNPWVSWASGIAAGLFATLFPCDCRLCGAPLINISRLPVCEDCLCAMRPISGGLCSICGERLVSPFVFSTEPSTDTRSAESAEVRCGLCRRLEPPYVKATAYGSYESGLRDLIHLLKYNRVRPAANVLGRMLAEAIEDLRPLVGGEVLVVPVPLHSRKLRQRGFNQSELIARAAMKLQGADSRFQLSATALERRRETKSQIGLSRHQRRENIRGAFVVANPDQLAGRKILVVDDVFTTGTTVSECARILRRAGASKVYVATVARTLKTETQHAVRESGTETRLAMAAAG